MPSDKTNPLSALGDGLVKWGDKYNANQLFDLTKQKTQKELEAADLGIEKTKQDLAFNSEYNPLRLQDAELSIAGKKTKNKLLETQATDAEWSLDDKLASKNIYGLLKTLDPKSRESLLADNDGFKYEDPITKRVLEITPAHIQAAKSMWDNEELNKKKINADINQSNAQANAVLKNADAHMITALASKGKAHNLTINGKPLPTKTQEQLGDLFNLMRLTEETKNSFDPKYVGVADSKMYDYFGKYFGDNSKESYFVSNSQALFNTLAKLRSGSAVTQNEYERLMKELPTRGTGETDFKTKLASFQRQLLDTLKSKVETQYKAGYDVSSFVPDYSAFQGNYANTMEWAGLKATPDGKIDKGTQLDGAKPSPNAIRTGVKLMSEDTGSKKIVKTGTDKAGRKVAMYEDGTMGYIQ